RGVAPVSLRSTRNRGRSHHLTQEEQRTGEALSNGDQEGPIDPEARGCGDHSYRDPRRRGGLRSRLVDLHEGPVPYLADPQSLLGRHPREVRLTTEWRNHSHAPEGPHQALVILEPEARDRDCQGSHPEP